MTTAGPRPSPRVRSVNRRLAIVPALNEEAAIGAVIAELRERAPGFDVLVVDDGSTDRTGDVVRRYDCHLVTLPFNCGIGGAMQTGFRFAEANGYDIVVQVDGDGQHDPAQLNALVAPLLSSDADIVIGSRRLGEMRPTYKTTPWRRLGIWSTAVLTSAVIGQRVTDGTSSFRAYDRRAIELFASEYPHGFLETIEASATARWHGLRLVEVPAVIRARTHGDSRISVLRSVFFALHVALSLSVGWLRRRRILKDERRALAGKS